MPASLKIKQLTPVLIVDAVEPCVAFWVEKLGFEMTQSVPAGDGTLVFAIVAKDGIEVMYQTRASVAAESPAIAPELTGHSTSLFLQVESLDDIELAVAGAPVFKARHKTFYGSEEIYVREPGGNLVGFAQF